MTQFEGMDDGLQGVWMVFGWCLDGVWMGFGWGIKMRLREIMGLSNSLVSIDCPGIYLLADGVCSGVEYYFTLFLLR